MKENKDKKKLFLINRWKKKKHCDFIELFYFKCGHTELFLLPTLMYRYYNRGLIFNEYFEINYELSFHFLNYTLGVKYRYNKSKP